MSSLQAIAVINLPFGKFMGDLLGLGNVGNLFGPRTLFSCIVLRMAERPEAKQQEEQAGGRGDEAKDGEERKWWTWGWVS